MGADGRSRAFVPREGGKVCLETLRSSVEEELADVELPYQHLRGV